MVGRCISEKTKELYITDCLLDYCQQNQYLIATEYIKYSQPLSKSYEAQYNLEYYAEEVAIF